MCHGLWAYEPLREDEWLDAPEAEDEEPLETTGDEPKERDPVLIADD